MKLPKKLQGKKALLNIKNEDDKCFTWSILAALHPVDRANNPNRVTKYIPYEAELDMKGIEYPVAARHYGKFENQNNNISINVFGYEDKKIFPLYITKQTDKQHHVNLLLYQEEGKSHYVLIKDLSRLVRSQYSKCERINISFVLTASMDVHHRKS